MIRGQEVRTDLRDPAIGAIGDASLQSISDVYRKKKRCLGGVPVVAVCAVTRLPRQLGCLKTRTFLKHPHCPD